MKITIEIYDGKSTIEIQPVTTAAALNSVAEKVDVGQAFVANYIIAQSSQDATTTINNGRTSAGNPTSEVFAWIKAQKQVTQNGDGNSIDIGSAAT